MPRKRDPKLRTQKTKLCIICGEVKTRSEFNVSHTEARKGCLSGYCKVCTRKENNEYRRTPEGLLTFMYNKIKYRIRREKDYKGLKLTFSKDQFKYFLYNSSDYMKYFRRWKKSSYLQAYVPSVDRLDSSKGYSLDNIRIVSHRENSSNTKTSTHTKPSTKYVGVCFDRSRELFSAGFTHRGKKINIGRYKTPLGAARAVNNKCKELGLPIKNPEIKDVKN